MTVLPQTLRIKIEKPHQSGTVAPAPSTSLRITGRTESHAERRERILKTIRSRTFGVLSDDDLELVGLSMNKQRRR